jgi:hypothetical protein
MIKPKVKGARGLSHNYARSQCPERIKVDCFLKAGI